MLLGITITAQPNGYVYIQNSPSDQVSVYNTQDFSLVTTIAVGDGPAGSDIHPDGSKVIVANGYSDNLSIISTTTNAVDTTITAGDYPTGIKFHPDGSKFYVSHLLSDNVKVFDSNSYEELANIPMNSYLHQIVCNSSGSLVYVAAHNTNLVYVLDSESNTIVHSISVGPKPYGLAIADELQRLYSTNYESGTVSVIDLTTHLVIETITVGSNPTGIELVPGEMKLYVCVAGENKVKVINANTNMIDDEINVGSFPNGIDYSHTLNKVWVTNALGNDASIIDVETDEVVETIGVGEGPHCGGANFINDQCNAVVISGHPQDQTQSVCGQVIFSIATIGSGPFEYAWYKNGNEIAGATSASYVTPSLAGDDNGSLYHCVVSNCNGIFQSTSDIATLTVTPPCIYTSPNVTLDKSTVTPGQSITVSGSHFTPYGNVDLSIVDESGESIGAGAPLAITELGIFEFVLPVTSEFLHGQYTISAHDVSTGNSAPNKIFLVNNQVFTPLEILFPSTADTLVQGHVFDIEWKDFVTGSGEMDQSGFLYRQYKIEVSVTNGSTWVHVRTVNVKAYYGVSNTYTYTYRVPESGPYIFRITEAANPINTDTSLPVTAIACDAGGFVASLEWYGMVPADVKSLKPNPHGLAADGTARIIVRLRKNAADQPVSMIQATLSSASNDGYTGPALLGKIAHVSEADIYETNTEYDAIQNDNSTATDYEFIVEAPDDFTTDTFSEEKYRKLTVDFVITYADNSTEAIALCEPFSICRPALMFVHGLNGNSKTFAGTRYKSNSGQMRSFSGAYIDIWKKIKFVDLKEWASFQTNADILLHKSLDEHNQYENSIISVLREMHSCGYANKRVDYVAHSMGGVIGRTVINNGNSDYSPGPTIMSNYGKGYINKFITICSPHNGSYVADLAQDAYYLGLFAAGQTAQTAVLAGVALLASYFKDFGIVHNGEISLAIQNMQAHSGGIPLNETIVKNHLLAADVDQFDAYTNQEKVIINDVNSYKSLYKVVHWVIGVNSFFNILYGTNAYLSESDIIVPLSSQLAGQQEEDAFNICANTHGASQTSVIYGLDKQHECIQKNDSIGTRLKVLLNARMASGFFADSIPEHTVNIDYLSGEPNTPQNRASVTCPDTTEVHFDTLKVRILSPSTNSIAYVDSTLTIETEIVDTIGFEYLQVTFDGAVAFSEMTDSVQFFQMAVDPLGNLGSKTIYAIAKYDSMGCAVFHADTVQIGINTVDTLIGFYIDPETRHLNPQHDFIPDFQVVYSAFIGRLQPGADSLEFAIQDTMVVTYDSLYHQFVTKDTGSTYIIFTYHGFSDTMYIYISTPIVDNVLSICQSESVVLKAGFIDSTKMYQWQVDTTTGFFNIVDNAFYSGSDSSILSIINPPVNWYNNKYRCMISDSIGATYSNIFTLKFGSVWTGAVDTEWENAMNWSCNEIPDSNNDVLIPALVPRFPEVNSMAACRSIRLEPTASVHVNPGFHLSVAGED